MLIVRRQKTVQAAQINPGNTVILVLVLADFPSGVVHRLQCLHIVRHIFLDLLHRHRGNNALIRPLHHIRFGHVHREQVGNVAGGQQDTEFFPPAAAFVLHVLDLDIQLFLQLLLDIVVVCLRSIVVVGNDDLDRLFAFGRGAGR
ncbi:hypothetical protein D3C75_779950 [compost metagenome]